MFGEGKLISTAFDGTIRLWDRNPPNVLFQHNGIARIAYFKGEDRGGPLDMDLSADADDADDDGAYAFAPPSSSASRLVISLTNGYIELMNTDVTELCDFLDGGAMTESIGSPSLSDMSDDVDYDDDDASDSDSDSNMQSSPAPASPSPSPFGFPSPSPAVSVPLSSSPIPFAPISYSPSPSSPHRRGRGRSQGLDLPELVSDTPPPSPTTTSTTTTTTSSGSGSGSGSASPLPRAFLRKTNRVEILWEVWAAALSGTVKAAFVDRQVPDQLGYSTSLQTSPCGRYLLTRRHMTRDGSEICCVFDMDQEATLIEKLRREGTSALTPEEEAVLYTPRGLARVFPNRLVHLIPDSSSGMGYIKEPCFSSHDPYFICSPYYKGLRLFRLEELRGNTQRNRTLPVLRHPSSLRPRRGWALLNTHHAPMMASGGLDGKVVFYLGGQDLHPSVPMRT
ncbi:uncharacterized protein ACA1_034070 [Acanthamoeba castellanii str. Neff]|uniref:WD domain, G-beta repeat-containing protein n=1 Tax=Acanthamoeba castellanii (strain ATCC 30010 / Neff) TaxID=1257118 RepID=L8GTF7_ACACF|nr:uncharacterized protein ACA1_034070 [Acanthamoeba castellanii str. Neff]ELR16469.1 hypothetical protein ACA1_034070 [Acanthamoeba castellanii str. Neff]